MTAEQCPGLTYTLPCSSADGSRWKPLCPAEKSPWHLNRVCCGAGMGREPVRSPITFYSRRAETDRTVVRLSTTFLTVVFAWPKRKEPSTDLCSWCRWWRPRSRAQHCGTWPPSGPSAWPCCCGWHRVELLPSRAGLCPQPGSPPVTGYRSSPSLAEQAACGTRSCQSQHDRDRGKGQERRGKGEHSQWPGFHCTGLACCEWHLPRKLLQLMAAAFESRPKASTAPASPPALPGTRLQVTAVVTGTALMSCQWRHLVGTKTRELNVTQDSFSNQGRPRCLWTSSWHSHHGSHLRRELPGAAESTTTRFTLKAVGESSSS